MKSPKTCDIKKEGLRLDVVNKEFRCRYHKIGDSYGTKKWGAANLCPDAFHSSYPYCLSLLYNAHFNTGANSDSILIQCPSSENYIILKVKRFQANNYVKLINFLKRPLKRFFYSVDVKKYIIQLEIVEIRGECPKNHFVGEIYEFNINDRSDLCPAAFNNIYPLIDFYMGENKFPWTDNGEAANIQCPDHKANIIFKIQKLQKRGAVDNECKLR